VRKGGLGDAPPSGHAPTGGSDRSRTNEVTQILHFTQVNGKSKIDASVTLPALPSELHSHEWERLDSNQRPGHFNWK
jgi:hypothetical protein